VDIKALPTGAHCLVDANIFIYHLGKTSPACRHLITRIARAEVEAYITTIIIAEVLHRRMMAEALAKAVVSAGQPLKKLKADPALITGLTDYVTEVEDLLLLPFSILEVTSADISASHAVRQRHGNVRQRLDQLGVRHAIRDRGCRDARFGLRARRRPQRLVTDRRLR
jgi:predicted nucleic acid-binding protein